MRKLRSVTLLRLFALVAGARGSRIVGALLIVVAGGVGALSTGCRSASTAMGSMEAPGSSVEETRPGTADSAIRALQKEASIPGISVAVADRGSIVYSKSFGLADVENDVPAGTSSVYRVASVAKPITAAAVLQLVEQGKLALDESIRAYVTALPQTYEGVTLRDLLRHTSGVRHYRDESELASTRHCTSLSDALDLFAADPLAHPPGEKITYSSYGYTLLGLAIEKASGLSYVDYVDEHVLEPAGMRSTAVDDSRIIRHRVRGYAFTGDGRLRNAELLDTSCRIPAGGFLATAEDLVRFISALESGLLISDSSRREMFRSQLTAEIIARTLDGMDVPQGFEPPGMGFGWAIEPGEGGAVYHGGNQPGFTAMLYHLPDRGLTVAVTANLEGMGSELTDLARRLAALDYPAR